MKNLPIKKILTGVWVLNLIALNALAVYGFLKIRNLSSGLTTVSGPILTPEIVADEAECDQDCRTYIDERIASVPAAVSTPGTATPRAAATAKPKTKTVSYFAIPGSGSTLNNNWTDVTGSDFYFDPAEHPGLIDVRFEVNLRLVNGNGMAYARLYDVTHSIGVNSEVSTNSQTSTLVTSGNVNFWSGRNQYRVQVKSLTADTAAYDSGRLRMVIEN